MTRFDKDSAGILEGFLDGDVVARKAFADMVEESGFTSLAGRIRTPAVVLMVNGYDTDAPLFIHVEPAFHDLVRGQNGSSWQHGDDDSNVLHALLGGDGAIKINKRLGRVITALPALCELCTFSED